MADLQAELARFEAEIGGAGGHAAAPAQGNLPPPPRLASPAGPQAHAGPSPAGPQIQSGPAAAGTPVVQHQQAPAAPMAGPQAGPAAPPAGMAPPGMLPFPPPGFPPPFPPPMFPPPMMVPMPGPAQPQPDQYQLRPPPGAGMAQTYAGQPVSNEAQLASVRAAFASQGADGTKQHQPAVSRSAAGKKWWDPTLIEWPENDFRIFVGDMGPEVTDEVLCKAFQHYDGFQMGKMIKNRLNNKNKGYGFVSFRDPATGAKALREMDGKYVGNRPCKLRKSSWEERNTYKGKGGRGGKGGRSGRGGGRGVLHK